MKHTNTIVDCVTEKQSDNSKHLHNETTSTYDGNPSKKEGKIGSEGVKELLDSKDKPSPTGNSSGGHSNEDLPSVK